MGSVVLHRTPPSAALSVRSLRARVSCSSSAHVSFIKDVAVTEPPAHLHHLLKVLQTRGETIISPGAKQGLIPLAIPLSQNLSGEMNIINIDILPINLVIVLIQFTFPTLVIVTEFVIRLCDCSSKVADCSTRVDEYIHRILVEEDIKGLSKLYHASGEAGEKLYRKGDFAESQMGNLDVYILKKVGLFPDVLERKVSRHFEEGDHVSAMVTGEFYTKKNLFPGFGRPFMYYANILQKVGQNNEAKDAARVALKSPWWTLGCSYKEVASIAQWEDEQIEYIKEKVTEEGRQEDLKKGKAPLQIALDEAAFLMDLASIEGTWSEFLDRIAECYKEAGLEDIARFVLYRD